MGNPGESVGCSWPTGACQLDRRTRPLQSTPSNAAPLHDRPQNKAINKHFERNPFTIVIRD